MWKVNELYKSLLIFNLVISTSLINISHAETLKVCYDQWAPMTIFPTEESTKRGIVIDMLEQIYSSNGFDIEYHEVPLARGLDMVTDGYCDMLPEYIYLENPDLGFVYATEKTFAYKTAFVTRIDDTWNYKGIESIKGRRIATGPGWDYSSMSFNYQNYIDDPTNADFIEVIAGYDDVVDRIFRMISENRVDLYADNELVLQHVLNHLNMHNKLKISRPGLEKDLVERPIFSKQIPLERRQKLIKIWNEGRVSLQGPQQGPQQDEILKKYNVRLQ